MKALTLSIRLSKDDGNSSPNFFTPLGVPYTVDETTYFHDLRNVSYTHAFIYESFHESLHLFIIISFYMQDFNRISYGLSLLAKVP
jgi:hypothetical protein